MVKTITVLAALILFSQAGQAQDLGQPHRELKPITHKLELEYAGKESSLDLDRFKKPTPQVRLRQKPKGKNLAFSPEGKPEMNLKATMPILRSDSGIQFPILAVKPDSTVYHHLRVKKT